MSSRRPDVPTDAADRAHEDAPSPQLRPAAASEPVVYPVDAPPPDIAPPLLLEPIPLPTVTGSMPAIRDAEQAAASDPYAWAAEAASSMERSGRSFDVLEDLPPPPEQHAPAPPTPAHPPARPRAASQPVRVPVRKGINDATMMWIIGVLTLSIVGTAFIFGMVFLFRASQSSGDDVLTPVSAKLDQQAQRTPRRPQFAVPKGDIVLPPGSTVDFQPDADPGEVEAPKARVDADGHPIGRVQVTTTPPGALIRIGGRIYGYTPADLDLSYGRYTVELSLEGHTPVTQAITVDEPLARITKALSTALQIGRVEVVARGWEGASLSIDGTKVATIPGVIELSAGPHTFVLTKGADVLTVDRRVMVDPGRSVRVDLTP